MVPHGARTRLARIASKLGSDMRMANGLALPLMFHRDFHCHDGIVGDADAPPSSVPCPPWPSIVHSLWD
jgi:hypothetical protein